MAKGYSLHLGLNAVDPTHYAGWSGELIACEADANDMAQIAQASGFETTTLLTKKATRAHVVEAIAGRARSCKAGDIFVLSYSGHGGQLPDLNGDESDSLDETWCLYDGEWVDDEIYKALSAFQKGVRVLMFSDSCHSGTVAKNVMLMEPLTKTEKPRARAMPNDVMLRVYMANKKYYDPILKNRKLANTRAAVQASVLLISGCQDNQLSMDGPFNGAFTGALKKVWNGGTFKGDYNKFHTKILAQLPADQSPNFFWAAQPDLGFAGQKPFTV